MPARNRDEFSAKVTDALVRRASYICSNPDCRALTICPSSQDPLKVIYVGKIAHITAASPGGPRYDASLTPAERSDVTNGIFLCSPCADMIDKNNGLDYPADVLRRWKSNHDVFVTENLNKSVHSLVGGRVPIIELTFDNGFEVLQIQKRKADKQFKKQKAELGSRIVRVDLLLTNSGNGVATDIDCTLDFEGNFQICTLGEVRGLWNMYPLDFFRNTEAYVERLFSKPQMPAKDLMVLTLTEQIDFGIFESLIAANREKRKNSVSRPARASVDGRRALFKVKKLKQNLTQQLESLFMVFPSWSTMSSFYVSYQINLEEKSVDRVGQLSVGIKKQ